MKIQTYIFFVLSLLLVVGACQKPGSSGVAESGAGLKIAFVNGDSILHKFTEFRKQSEVMEAKQRKAENELQQKGAALEKEIMAYQKKAQSGTMTGKEMEAHEKYLSSRQEAVLAERDRMAKEIMDETEEINKRLQAVLHEKLNEVKKRDGYDFILNSAEGGSVLAANDKHNITDQVLAMLNKEGTTSPNTTDSKN